MLNKEEQGAWDDLKNIWNESSQNKEIKIVMSQLIIELENKTSQFEKDSIKRDIKFIERNTSQFEKDSIKRDIILFKRLTSQFENNFIKPGINIFTRVLKKFITKIKGKNKNQ
ncbi:hypothetical protein [Aquimarina sp. 2201CG5-10]|uniref:hypothetical protein n=1 Tax=Aquimarina callyspongiae TaxID=3098150 RepID=UPI002AB5D537|nr:hypothetical protein [Aquimarina sp. 2201CG5-10]MDY8135997.1 hypothetical protein [Aquimarina sp. 2201CG5-10]